MKETQIKDKLALLYNHLSHSYPSDEITLDMLKEIIDDIPTPTDKLNLDELSKRVDDALSKETPESLKKWLEEKRNNLSPEFTQILHNTLKKSHSKFPTKIDEPKKELTTNKHYIVKVHDKINLRELKRAGLPDILVVEENPVSPSFFRTLDAKFTLPKISCTIINLYYEKELKPLTEADKTIIIGKYCTQTGVVHTNEINAIQFALKEANKRIFKTKQ